MNVGCSLFVISGQSITEFASRRYALPEDQSRSKNSSGRTCVQPLSRNTAQGASQNPKKVTARPRCEARERRYFFIFFFFFGLVAMGYFLLSVMDERQG
jgi:hypothetical protein